MSGIANNMPTLPGGDIGTCLCNLAPTYFLDQPLQCISQTALGSVDQHLLVILSLKDFYSASTGARVFLALALAWWNHLPNDIWMLQDLMQFCRACETETFSKVCGWGGKELYIICLPLLSLAGLFTLSCLVLCSAYVLVPPVLVLTCMPPSVLFIIYLHTERVLGSWQTIIEKSDVTRI